MSNRDEASQLVIHALRAAAHVLAENADELDELDAVAGDADHGTTMATGSALAHAAARAATGGAGDRLVAAGIAWGSAGGASSTVWRVLLTSFGESIRDGVTGEHLAAAARHAVTAVERSGAHPGDKSIVDVLEPAVGAFSATIEAGAGVREALWSAAGVAEEAATETAALVGTLVGDGTRDDIGVPDPGAASCALVCQAIFDALNEA